MKKSILKKAFITLTSLLICLMLSISSFAAILGDVDGDGLIKSADARLALRASVKLETLTDEQLKLADVDCSGDIKAADARSILRAAVGLEELSIKHKFSEWTVEKEATCTSDGLKTRACPCGEKETKTIPATGEHSFGKWTVTKKATCTKSGLKTRACECGEKETQTIPAGHTFTVEKATVSQSKVCTRCKKVEEKSFNEYVNSIKTQPHIISHLSISENKSAVTKDTIKIDRAQLFLLLTMSGLSAKEANKEINAMENELKNGMNYEETVNSTFYKNRTLTDNNFPIEGSNIVSKLEDGDVVSYTVEKVKAVDFKEFLDTTYTATNTGYKYDTSAYRYLEADNLIKLTVVLKTEKYSEINNTGEEETALMRATGVNIRDLADGLVEFSAGADMEDFATASCNEITTDETIIVYFDTENNAPVAACYISSIVCEPTISMDLLGIIKGAMDFTTDSKVVSLYFFDDYFAK